MITVNKQISPTKETVELVDFIGSFIDKLRELKGKTTPEKIASLTGLLPAGVTAIDGVDNLDEEAKSKNLDDNIAYFTKQLLERVVPSARGSELDV